MTERHLSPLQQLLVEKVGERESAEVEIRALVAATFDVIATTDTVDVPIRDILDASGLSRQVFYRYFESKDELLVVVLGESRHILARYLADRMGRVQGADAQIRAWIDGVLRQAQN